MRGCRVCRQSGFVLLALTSGHQAAAAACPLAAAARACPTARLPLQPPAAPHRCDCPINNDFQMGAALQFMCVKAPGSRAGRQRTWRPFLGISRALSCFFFVSFSFAFLPFFLWHRLNFKSSPKLSQGRPQRNPFHWNPSTSPPPPCRLSCLQHTDQHLLLALSLSHPLFLMIMTRHYESDEQLKDSQAGRQAGRRIQSLVQLEWHFASRCFRCHAPQFERRTIRRSLPDCQLSVQSYTNVRGHSSAASLRSCSF